MYTCQKELTKAVENYFTHQVLGSVPALCSDPPELSEQKPSEWIVDSEQFADAPTFPSTPMGHLGYVRWPNPVCVRLG